MLPQWIRSNKDFISTGSGVTDQIITVLLDTSMFVAGFLGFILDNTIPGTDKERGVDKWRAQHDLEDTKDSGSQCYNFPYGMELVKR